MSIGLLILLLSWVPYQLPGRSAPSDLFLAPTARAGTGRGGDVIGLLTSSLLGLLFFAVPVGFSLGIATLLVVMTQGSFPTEVIMQRAIAGVRSFPMLALPLFVLVGYLIDLHIDTVIVVGGSTSNCVRATVVDASQYNFRVLVPQEAVFDRLPLSHSVALFDMNRTYADVMPAREVVQYLQELSRSPHHTWHGQSGCVHTHIGF